MLKVENINVYYGQIHAIKDVSFEVHEGEIVSLIGANGAGKSTILKTISGLLRSKTGHITFKGEDISKVEAFTFESKWERSWFTANTMLCRITGEALR